MLLKNNRTQNTPLQKVDEDAQGGCIDTIQSIYRHGNPGLYRFHKYTTSLRVYFSE